MAGSWQPQEDSLRLMMQLLEDIQSPDNATQIAAQQMVEELKKYWDFNHYLMHVITRMTLDDASVYEGVLGILLKICEDSSKEKLDNSLFNVLLPKCLQFFQHSSSKIRSLALAVASKFIKKETNAVINHMDDLLQGLMHLVAGDDVEIRMNVSRAFVSLMDTQMDLLVPYMDRIIESMFGCSQDSNDSVALEACEFWWSLSKQTICKQVLVNRHLVLLVPILLKWMRLSVSDMIRLKINDEEDDAIRITNNKEKTDSKQDEEETNEADDDDEDEVHSYGAPPGRNLRKSSVATLDALSQVYKDELLPIVLPTLKETLYHSEWKMVESGILALGAIAEGCKQDMADHLAELFPFLISCLSEKKGVVRYTTRITLCSRYAPLLVSQPHDQYLNPLMTELLKRIEKDENKCNQQAACIALATLQEEAGTELVPYLGEILETLVRAYGQYHQRKSLLCLYDAISTLARSVGGELNKADFINLLMPPLITKLNLLKDDDKDLIPLLHCLSYVAPALQSGFLPYFEIAFPRCISLVEQSTIRHIEHIEQPDKFEASNKDFTAAALNLLFGLTKGLGSQIEGYIVASNIMQLLLNSLEDPLPNVRQYAFALLGALTKACFGLVHPFLEEFLPILVKNLDPDIPSVCSNAVCAIGELALKLGSDMHNHIPLFQTQLISIMNRPETQKALLENTAVTLGRMGFVCPMGVAFRLPDFAESWSKSIEGVRDGEEKESAFRGLCRMMANDCVERRRIGVDLFYFCVAATSWVNSPSDLKEQFVEILNYFKNCWTSEEGWKTWTDKFPKPFREQMKNRFGV